MDRTALKSQQQPLRKIAGPSAGIPVYICIILQGSQVTTGHIGLFKYTSLFVGTLTMKPSTSLTIRTTPNADVSQKPTWMLHDKKKVVASQATWIVRVSILRKCKLF